MSGSLTFKGNPVAEGTISFTNTGTGAGAEGPVSNGAFKLSSPLPPGEYKVVVLPLVERKQEGGKGPEVGVEKPAPDIPPKYRVIGTTTLTATVKEGKNDITLNMTP